MNRKKNVQISINKKLSIRAKSEIFPPFRVIEEKMKEY